MANDKELARKVVQILNEGSVSRIHFRLGGLRISGDDFGRVAWAIEKGAISVELNPYLPKEVPGSYDSRTNTIELKYRDLSDVALRGVAVHECTHALIDLVVAKATRRLASEAAAFLAESIYLYQELGDIAFTYFAVDHNTDPKGGKISAACLAAIKGDKLVQYDNAVSSKLYQPILGAIKSHSVYNPITWNEKVQADGIGFMETRERGGCSFSQYGLLPPRFRPPLPQSGSLAWMGQGLGAVAPRIRPFNWNSNAIPPRSLQTMFRPDRPGQPGWGMEVTRSPRPGSLAWMGQGLGAVAPRIRPFNWNSNAIPPRSLQTMFRPDRPGQPGWGMEVTRSPRPGSLAWMGQGLGSEMPRARPWSPATGSLAWMGQGLRSEMPRARPWSPATGSLAWMAQGLTGA